MLKLLIEILKYREIQSFSVHICEEFQIQLFFFRFHSNYEEEIYVLFFYEFIHWVAVSF